jgi:hypothetical protein
MKHGLTGLLSLITWVAFTVPQTLAQTNSRLFYTLLDGSEFVDDCPVCGRPTILQPLRGTFELVLIQNTPPYTKYAVQNINFTASPGSSLERRITGNGTYERFEEFALIQRMTLATQTKDNYTNTTAFFTNAATVIPKPFPLIQVDLNQTNGTLLHTFSMHLLAAPIREIWFSTARAFTSTNRSSPTNQIGGGDLLSSNGRVVRRNIDLVGRLGVTPSTPDLGLDAANVTRRGEILFSIPVNVFSETLGWIQHGDLLSDRGLIVKRNQDLLAAFQPTFTGDAGLDAVQLMPNGEILFSIQSNVVVSSTLTLSRGDILSDTGGVFRTHQQLLSNFQPAVTNYDFGLDALYVLPSGEIWFSVEEGFTDNQLGTIQAGDLLSDLGYRVFRNQDLLAAFAPADPALDYGLDALFVVTDTQLPKPAPLIISSGCAADVMHLEWDGGGDVFQVESASSPTGAWTACSPIVPDLSADLCCDPSAGPSVFYRLRQW